MKLFVVLTLLSLAQVEPAPATEPATAPAVEPAPVDTAPAAAPAPAAPVPSDSAPPVDTTPAAEVPPSPREAFAARALRLLPDEESALTGPVTLLSGRGRVVRADGSALSEPELLALAPDERVREGLSARRHQEGMRVPLLAGSIAVVVVPAVLAVVCGVVGAGAGMLLLAALGGLPDPGADPPALGDGVARLVLGAWAGALMGAGAGALLLAIPAFIGVQAARPLWQVPSLRTLQAQVVVAHNQRLADELGLDPATLGPDYFPTGR